ncbi:excalibur calcium-binding protein [Streptomyces sp. WAC01280]|uniref:excalibur calcium-binding protein n=1 Tax=Streptomyces sp. WAC01280 TaxID=2487424 RepID=UPI00163BE060|nr:excalibur calcium-binding protein [Streptomyces sp. WAC01280]
MSSRSGVAAGIALAIASVTSVAALSGVAHAQDLDCRNFRYQEDAQAEFNRDTRDPHRLDEDQGPDDGIACEALPRRTSADTVQPLSPNATAVPSTAPVVPTPVVPAPVVPAPTVPAPVVPAPVVPSLGTRAGVGGASGPSALSLGIGLALAAGASVAGGHLTARRLTARRLTARRLTRGSKRPSS